MGRRAFVFNGLIKDLSFPRPLEGRIVGQKIRSLLKHGPGSADVGADLAAGVREIEAHAREIQALNIGLIEDGRIAVYSHSAGGIAYCGIDADNGLGIFFPYK
jgi:hypothetical protein